MNREGHVGFTLLIFSILMMPFGVNTNTIIVIGIAAVFSFLPDIDFKLELAHRKYTHNILAAMLFGLVFFILFYIGGNLTIASLAFLGVFGGVVSHILGDMLAGRTKSGGPWKLQPLWPFSNVELGWGFFKSSDKNMNNAFLLLGVFGLVAFVMIGA